MRILCLAVLLAAFATHVQAATSEWLEVAPGTSIRLISSDVIDANDQMMVGFEVDLAPQTKTYWRVPGETGIPVQLDFSASTGVEPASIHWPIPMREIAGGYVDHVYYGHLLMPIALHVNDPTQSIELAVNMGVCSDICVPVSGQLSVSPHRGERDMASDLQIKQALADVPIDWKDDNTPFGSVSFDPQADALRINDVDPELDLRTLFARIDDAALVFGTPQKSPIPGVVTMPRLGRGDPPELEGKSLFLIFQTNAGPYRVQTIVGGIEQATASE